MNQHFTTALYEGTFSVGLDKRFNRIDRDQKPQKGALKISINPFLIHSTDKNILIDAGLGEFGEDTSCQTIISNLAEHDIEPFEVTDILLSHLHYDHMGGLAGRENGYWELTFPDARLWVSKPGWQKIMEMDVYHDSRKTEFIHFLDAQAEICYLNGNEDEEEDEDKNEELPQSLKTETIGGHTEDHQAIFFDDGQQKCIMAGDVLATRGHVNRKFAAKYDFDAQQSIRARNRLLKKAYAHNYTLLGYHDNQYPIFRLTGFDDKKGYSIKAVENGEI